MAEHAFKIIGRDIKENRIGSTVLMYGRENYLIDWAAGLLKERFVNPAVEAIDFTQIEAAEADISDVEGACEMLPLMSERKMVVVRFSDVKSKIKDSELKEYMKNVPATTLLVICRYQESVPKAVLDAAENAVVYDFGILDERSLTAFIAKEFRLAGKAASAPVIRQFIQESGYYHKDSEYTLYNLKNDIVKLCAHCMSDQVTSEDVEAVTSGNMEKNIFAMVDSICRNRKDEALRLLHNLMSGGVSAMSISGMIVSQYEIILSVKELREQGFNTEQIRKTLKIHEYRVKKAMPLAGRYSADELKNILIKAYSIDNDIKSGTLDDITALEVFISEV